MTRKNVCFLHSGLSQRTLFFVLLFLIPLFIQSQESETEIINDEKVYLQLNSRAYNTGESIWFKAIVINDQNHSLTKKSNVLHVELINPEGEKISHQKIKLLEGIGHGALDIENNLREGRYLLRAYTRWNLNFKDNFSYKNYVDIVTAGKVIPKEILDSVSYNLTGDGTAQIYGSIKDGLDNLAGKKEITLYLNRKAGKDTIVMRKINNNFSFSYKVPHDVSRLNLSLRTDSLNYVQTILLKKVAPDLQFLPESGRLIHGFQNKIGFKALGQDGKGVEVQGTIFNSRGEKVTTFRSNSLGMGVVTIKADSTQSYYAKLDSIEDSDFENSYQLPKVYPKGSILSISEINEKVQVKVASNNIMDDYAFVKISCRGHDYFLVEGPLQNGYLTKALPSKDLPPGILKFTLIDKNGMSIGERLFFNDSAKDRFDIEIRTNKDKYDFREKTNLTINVTDEKIDLSTINLSVTAIKEDHWHQGEDDNIFTYFLLSSELRGEIEQPGYYFQKNNFNNSKDLDALLLTQGWRNYKFPVTRKSDSLVFPEKGIELNGRIRFPFQDEKLAKNVNINVAAFGKNSTFYTGRTDSLARFRFLLEDEYGQIPVLVSTEGNTSKNKIDFKIQIEKFQSPNIIYHSIPGGNEIDTLLQPVREMRKLRNSAPKAFSTQGVNELDEVLLTGKGATSEELERYKKYGDPDVIISGEEIREKEKKWSYGLYSILLFNYGDEIEIEKFSDGFMLAHIRAGRGEPTLLLIDGQLLKKHQYELVPHMDPGVVEKVELIKYAKFFKNRYLQVFPQTDPLKAPSLGHIISITTKGGGGIFGQGKPAVGSLRTSVQGFTQVKEFYSPTYERVLTPGEKKTDFRSLVHWMPSLEVNRNGKASVQFYNPDVPGDYIIIIEGITRNGKIGYQEKKYRIKN
ncbi:hypothetical protein [Salegentibacter sp. Hel_I_6]|uniref:hypothetical protein n=1 Tax=Salegentibacter sp. Hel_I_6 TaxID=1250278 RepID=UPI0005632D02|nr:hypothetical protein [Salegentibacter sp. Hel_I_6]